MPNVEMPTYIKDPSSVLDYKLDWSDELDGDTIVSSTWTVPADFTQPTAIAHDTTSTAIWLGSGVLGNTYIVTNHITTAGSRQEDQSIVIVIKDK